jgi:phosphatidylserine/phosphatidylglycerophosphate/cardiolipin synthase-like enzyme
VILLASLLISTAAIARVDVLFSPGGGCDRAVARLAHASQTYLDAACYTFTLDAVADELIAAKRRGVNVRVILDRQQAGQTWSTAKRLLAARIPVKVNSHSGLMHDKFLVADGHSVATGSYNWTNAATHKNDESLALFSNESAVAKAFAGQFDRMWQDTTRFVVFSPSATVRVSAAPTKALAKGYIGSKHSRVYHLPTCIWAARIRPENLVHFKSKAEAEAAGRRPCKVCKP